MPTKMVTISVITANTGVLTAEKSEMRMQTVSVINAANVPIMQMRMMTVFAIIRPIAKTEKMQPAGKFIKIVAIMAEDTEIIINLEQYAK